MNNPCAGYGDIIACKTFYDYLKTWYSGINVTICTSTPSKFKELNVRGNIIQLRYPHKSWQGGECKPLHLLKLQRIDGKIPRFDILIVVPIVNDRLDINRLKKCIPYVNNFNTFTISEYNGDFPPYTFPIGIKRNNLGLFLTDNLKIPKQKLLTKPYALAYTAGHETSASTHTDTCILSFIEMICKKYHKKYVRFQLVTPPWFKDELLEKSQLKTRYNNIVKKYYSSSTMIYDKNEIYELFDTGKNKSQFILRGDILPKSREVFISLIRQL